MTTLITSISVGIIIGTLDITPMIIKKLPRYSIIASFLFFLFISIVIFHINLPYIPWWMEGGLVSIAMMVPILIHVAETDKKPIPIIVINAIVLGTIISVVKHYFM